MDLSQRKKVWWHELLLISAWIVPLAFFAISPSVWFPASSLKFSGPILAHAAALVEASDAVSERFEAIGAPSFPVCIRCAARLNSGRMILDLGEGALNAQPHSLIVYAIDQNYRGMFPTSGYRVSISADLRNWHFVGSAAGIATWRSSVWQEIRFRYVLIEAAPEAGKRSAQIDAIEIRG